MSYIQDFEKLVQEQLKRVERMKNEPPAIDYSGLDKIIIGFVDGDAHRSRHHEADAESSR